jgi:hypothetical protein
MSIGEETLQESDLRIVDDELPIRIPACEFQIRVLVEIGNSVAVDLGTCPAFGLVLECCIFDGEVLGFGVAATVLDFGGVWLCELRFLFADREAYSLRRTQEHRTA